MKEIAITKGKTVFVDDADFEWLNQWRWYAQIPAGRNTCYAMRWAKRPDGGILPKEEE